MASQGIAEAEIGGEVRVTIVSTGDELVAPGGELTAGQIFDSNSVLLLSLVAKYGATIAKVVRCPDDEAAIEGAFRDALQFEVLIVLGGVSVGARDLVKPALNGIGAVTDLWRVSVKPGKPFLFGRAQNCAIFGLPGNPVSAFVTFLLFVRPALLRMMGASDKELSLPCVNAVLADEGLSNEGDRPHYVRGQLRDGKFVAMGRQESHALYGLSRANAIARIPSGAVFANGETIAVIPLS